MYIIEFLGVGILNLRPSAQGETGKGKCYHQARNFTGLMGISQGKPILIMASLTTHNGGQI
jgi:hypothetical protein